MNKIKFLGFAVMAAFMAFGFTSCEKENFSTDANVTVTPPTINIPGLPEDYKPGDAVVSIQPTVNALINGDISNVTEKAIIKFNDEEAKHKVLTGKTIAAQEITITVQYTAVVEGFEKELTATDIVSIPELKAGMVAIITPTVWLSATTEGYSFHEVGETELGAVNKEYIIENKTDYWYADYDAELKYIKEGRYVTNKEILPGYENDEEVVKVFDMYAKGVATEFVYEKFKVEDITVYAQSQTIIPYSQVKISTDYEVIKEMTWSRSTEVKTVAKFTIEQYGALTFDIEEIKYDVNLKGEAHGHGHGKGHGHAHGGNANAGGSIVDAL